jgi:hypothetical protein
MDIFNPPENYYENLEFTVADATTNQQLSLQTGWGAFFGVGPAATNKGGHANKISIRTDQTITVKLNSTSEHAITVRASDSPFELSGIEIAEAYFTNASGSTANVKVFLTR